MSLLLNRDPNRNFLFGDSHPSIKNITFAQYLGDKEVWRTADDRARQYELARLWRIANANTRDGLARTLYNSASRHAAHRGLKFSLTIEQIASVIPTDWRCPVLGTRFIYGRGRLGATYDRVLNDRGYEWGMAAWCAAP